MDGDKGIIQPFLPRPYDSHRVSAVTGTNTVAVREGVAQRRRDWLASEEPLEIRAQGPGQEATSVSVTMRTPGHDDELAVGFMYAEGLLHSREDIVAVDADALRPGGHPCNIVTVHLAHPFSLDSVRRNFAAHSSCGLCGKVSIRQVAIHCTPLPPGPELSRTALVRLPAALHEAQQLFMRTGGLHAAGLFDLDGRLISLREDVGRHNAVDKLVGHMLLAGTMPLTDRVLLVSGRTSFELIQKAAMAGVPIVCAVSAPSSLAVEAARQFRMTLVGFLRGENFNIYTHPERIALDS